MSSPGLRDYPDCDTWISFLDECGIQTTIVYPTAALAFGLIQDPAWAVDIARAYNSWLHASYTKRTSRILGAALIPIHDVPSRSRSCVASKKNWACRRRCCHRSPTCAKVTVMRVSFRSMKKRVAGHALGGSWRAAVDWGLISSKASPKFTRWNIRCR